MSEVSCRECGSKAVFLAWASKRDGSEGWQLFEGTPGGAMKSFQITQKGNKKHATFVKMDEQVEGVDYYAAHYKVCKKSGPATAPRAQSGGIAISMQFGGKNFTGFVNEEAF